MEGWVCLYRKILEWQWYSDKNVRLVFLHLLLKANHKERMWQNTLIKRGQLVSSYSNLAKEIGITIQQLRTALDKLKSTNEITVETTNKFTLITIEKYSFYQDIDLKNNIQNNTEDNKQITNKQQTNNNQITTNNNVTIKQCNNNNNISNNNYLYNTREKILKGTKEICEKYNISTKIDLEKNKGEQNSECERNEL